MKSILTAICATIMATSAAQAALVTVQQDVDLTEPMNSSGTSNRFFREFYQWPFITVETGDTVSLTFNFLNGRLNMKNSTEVPSVFDHVTPVLVFPWLGESAFGISDIQFTFLDAVATGGAETHFSLEPQEQLNMTSSLGPTLVEFLPGGASLSFSGIQATFYVDFVNGNQLDYVPLLSIAADELTVIPIPEPSTLALGTLALLILGGRSLCRSR